MSEASPALQLVQSSLEHALSSAVPVYETNSAGTAPGDACTDSPATAGVTRRTRAL